jgi:hypothetical protein
MEFGDALKRARMQKPVLDWSELTVISKRFQINRYFYCFFLMLNKAQIERCRDTHPIVILICEFSEGGLQNAVNKLQQLGILLYFPLHDLVVISPIWLSYILSSISKFSVDEGILMHNTLQSAWKVCRREGRRGRRESCIHFYVVDSVLVSICGHFNKI